MRNLFFDSVHVSDFGNEVISDNILSILKKNYDNYSWYYLFYNLIIGYYILVFKKKNDKDDDGKPPEDNYTLY